MERAVLKQFLRAGPSRRFDVAALSRRIAQETPGQPLLFHTRFLNQAILLKLARGGGDRPVRAGEPFADTLIYLPYDDGKPGDGGEGFVFTPEMFRKICEDKLSQHDHHATPNPGDVDKLRVLRALPTFSPFLVELAFQRAGIELGASSAQLSPALRRKITCHLKGRLRPLIVAAFKSSAANVDRAVEELVQKLYCMRDFDGFKPLAGALRLPPEQAAGLFNAWLGITYFEHEYSILQPRLAALAGWLGKLGNNVKERYSRSEGECLSYMIQEIRKQVREDWNEVVGISQDYRVSYEGLVFNGCIEPFTAFLSEAEAHYWTMGDLLGRLEQTVLAWRDCGGCKPDTFESDDSNPFTTLCAILEALRHLHRTTGDSSPLRAAAPAPPLRRAHWK